MAKIPFGVLGPFFGKVGPVSGYKWKEISVMRSLRGKSNKPPTEAQLQQREKFGFTSKFLKGISDLIKIGFGELAIGKTEYQCAMSYNLDNAVSGKRPDFKLHYDKVAVSRGSLPNAVFPEVKAGDNASELRFIWADNSGIGLAAATDHAIAAVYCPAVKRWTFRQAPDAKRADCSALLVVPAFSGQTVHTWLTFVSEAGKASDSVYTGEIVVK